MTRQGAFEDRSPSPRSWGVVAAGPRIVVVDTNNHRLQGWPARRLEAHP